jgi:hypothetical protein
MALWSLTIPFLLFRSLSEQSLCENVLPRGWVFTQVKPAAPLILQLVKGVNREFAIVKR